MKTLLSRGKGLAARAARGTRGGHTPSWDENGSGEGDGSSHGLDLSQVTLMSTGSYHTDVLMAKVGHDLVGGMGMEEATWDDIVSEHRNCISQLPEDPSCRI